MPSSTEITLNFQRARGRSTSYDVIVVDNNEEILYRGSIPAPENQQIFSVTFRQTNASR